VKLTIGNLQLRIRSKCSGNLSKENICQCAITTRNHPPRLGCDVRRPANSLAGNRTKQEKRLAAPSRARCRWGFMLLEPHLQGRRFSVLPRHLSYRVRGNNERIAFACQAAAESNTIASANTPFRSSRYAQSAQH
jgi:hypothetical protein